ncbi:Insecticial toxin [Xenorhabdus bovienii]|uniref:Insecticial toxin n=1 Tax=Xenorhabdus bovienii TaxID=40576 RepID=UPI00237CE809|nr:Insecticial toxin [Xenorhabdus bovienii]
MKAYKNKERDKSSKNYPYNSQSIAETGGYNSDKMISRQRKTYKNDPKIIEQVEQKFIWRGHREAIEEASIKGNFAVSFRAAGKPTLEALSQGAAAKGHDILEKTIKQSSIEKAYGDQASDVLDKVRKAGIEGYVGHWVVSAEKSGEELKGIYMSSGHGLSDKQVKGKIYDFDLNNLDASLSALKEQDKWAALPFTGDYDMHDMISFTTQPHSVPSDSPAEKKIIKLINQYVAKSDPNRPFEDIEHNVIRHGPQVSYPAFALDKEKAKKSGGLVKSVAEAGEFPVAFICKGVWTIVNNIKELDEFYKSIGAKMKVSWKPGAENPKFTHDPEKNKSGKVGFTPPYPRSNKAVTK